MSYGAILQGNSTDRNKVLKTQKKIIRIMAGVRSDSFMVLFRRFNIPLFARSGFVLKLLSFVVENLQNFEEIQMFTV